MGETVWTAKRLEFLYLLRAQKVTVQEIADRLCLKKRVVENRLYWDKLTPLERTARRAKINERRRAEKLASETRITVEKIDVSARPTVEQIRSRDLRATLPYRDLTAMLCGDPPLGMSALDARGQVSA